MKQIKLMRDVTILGKPWKAGVYNIPDQIPVDLAEWLVKKEFAEMLEIPKVEEKKIEIDPELANWLVSKGFTKGLTGVAFVKTEKLGADIVKLQVDFSDSPKGTRYGYRLDFSSDPPQWKSDAALRDHPLLLEYKNFRDQLFASREKKPELAKIEELSEEERQKILAAVEARDDEQILAELSGDFKSEIVKQFFYSFESMGRKVIGLSFKGIKQIVQKMGNIEVTDLDLKETEKAWIAICKARDRVRNIEIYGAAIQMKEMTLRDGSKIQDQFALTKAVSKAQRNALRGLISEVVITEAYKRWLEGQGG